MPSDLEILRTFLADRDASCPVCGYNLRGLDREACPECGARLELRVGSDFTIRPWLLSVLAVTLPLGFTLVLAVMAAVGALGAPALMEPAEWFMLALLWLLSVFYGGVLWGLMKRRPRFLRRSPRAQWINAGLLTAVMAAMLLASIGLLVRYL